MQQLILHKDLNNLGEFGIQTAELATITKAKHSQIITRRPKVVPQELINQAIANNPLETMPRWEFSDQVKASSSFRQTLPSMKEAFLNTHFLLFSDLGITFETSESEVTDRIAKMLKQKSHLGAHCAALGVSFKAFQQVFSFIDLITEKGKFEEKHLTSIYSICTAYAAINDVVRGAKLMKPIGLQVHFNRERYIFEIPTVLSTSNLAEILLAMPVCFLSVGNTVSEEDPRPSSATKMFCDAIGSKNFAWFYQLYNRRDRAIKNFQGPDPIPSDYLEFRPQLERLVSLEVIATPYHSISTKEWCDPSWQSSIDPIAFGLYDDIPFFTIFKRWSGNGIFPLLADLMADTISHIKTNMNSLRNFRNPYWYKAGGTGDTSLGDSTKLTTFAQSLVQNFSEGKVFDFLRS